MNSVGKSTGSEKKDDAIFAKSVLDKGNIEDIKLLRIPRKHSEILAYKRHSVATIRRTAITAAIGKTNREIAAQVRGCQSIETHFRGNRIKTDAVLDRLKKEEAQFDVQILLNNVWEEAILCVSITKTSSYIQILVGAPDSTKILEKERLVPEQDSTISVNVGCPLTFTLKLSCHSSYTCLVKNNTLRDEIVVTVKAFQMTCYYTWFGPFQNFIKPKKGWVKLNIEVCEDGIGGLIQDESGNWITGFCRRIKPVEEIIESDLLAFKEGIILAAAIDEKVEIDHGSHELEDLLEETRFDYPPHILHLATECRNLLKKLKDYELRFRAFCAISSAFELAIRGSELRHMNLVKFVECPEVVHRVLLGEMLGQSK